MSKKKTPNTRSNSTTDERPSLGGESLLDNVRTLIRESEQRILSKLESIVVRMDKIDEKIDRIAAEQVRLDLELSKVKDIIVSQQQALEAHEGERRQLNLIFSGVPETDVEVGDEECLEDDEEKISFLCEKIDSEFCSRSIESYTRLGKRRLGINRLLKVKFTERSVRNATLYSQRKIREDQECVSSFGRVYINKDLSPLCRKEEKRLREVLHDEKKRASPETKCFLKAGKLFRNSEVIDSFDIKNQLF